jgi:5-methylcytosine-specific restriction endonuclease McrA
LADSAAIRSARYRAKHRDERNAESSTWWAEHGEKYREENREKFRLAAAKYREANKERVNARSKAWREANSERQREFEINYRKSNPEKRKASCAAYRAKPGIIEKEREARKIWASKNKIHLAAESANRRAQKKRAGGFYSAADIAALKKSQKSKCAYSWCKKSLQGGFHVDHIKPLSLGGSNEPRNLQLLCPNCNLRKNAKDPVTFAQENGLLI